MAAMGRGGHRRQAAQPIDQGDGRIPTVNQPMSEAEVNKLEEILEDEAKAKQWREQRHQERERLRVRGACVNVLLVSVVFVLLLVLWFWIAGRM